MKYLAMAMLASTMMAAGAHAQAPKVVLVELFTSEGCSSCPPADALLSRIAGTQVAGSLVVGLSEHVTYWNYLGWKDPYSQELFTQRQNAYGDRFQLRSVYTPQIVVNGAREVLGSDSEAVTRAVSETAIPAMKIRIGDVHVDGRTARVAYTLDGNAQGAELFGVVAEDMVSSSVTRGENGGRKLTHVAVARNLVDLGKAVGGTVNVSVPDGMHGNWHMVLFVQAKGQGKVLALESKAVTTVPGTAVGQ